MRKNPTMDNRSLSLPSSLRGESIAIVGGELRPQASRRLREHRGCEVTHFATADRDASPQRRLRFANRKFDLSLRIFGRSRHAHGD